jgi:hypothetical protein
MNPRSRSIPGVPSQNPTPKGVWDFWDRNRHESQKYNGTEMGFWDELKPVASAIRRRREIWEALHPVSGNSVPTLGGRGNISFAADTCAAAGITKRSVNEHLSRADALGSDLDAVVGTKQHRPNKTETRPRPPLIHLEKPKCH